jgi:hypothetical protein
MMSVITCAKILIARRILWGKNLTEKKTEKKDSDCLN